jgi:hypothetical protein
MNWCRLTAESARRRYQNPGAAGRERRAQGPELLQYRGRQRARAGHQHVVRMKQLRPAVVIDVVPKEKLEGHRG